MQKCKNTDCIIDVGDDCIAIKSGVEDSLVKEPCENITITNCVMVHGHGGIVIGSEAAASKECCCLKLRISGYR